MGLYEITGSGLEERKVKSFASLGLKERDDLQRLLRDQIAVLDEDLLVLSEEFGNWEGANRRIDLLALDPAGRLVVIELKRTDDGGHMELQAIRYAAMVSAMSFDEVVDTYAKHCVKHRPDESVDARVEIEEFLDGDGEVATISSDVRIILVSADFGLEITTTVLWLNRLEGMDIRCVRLRAYTVEDRTLIDVQQVLPLPAAGDYQVKIRRKEVARERSRTNTKDYTQYQIVVDGQALPAVKKRHAVRTMMAELIKKGVSVADMDDAIPGSRLRIVAGELADQGDVQEALVATHSPHGGCRGAACRSFRGCAVRAACLPARGQPARAGGRKRRGPVPGSSRQPWWVFWRWQGPQRGSWLSSLVVWSLTQGWRWSIWMPTLWLQAMLEQRRFWASRAVRWWALSPRP